MTTFFLLGTAIFVFACITAVGIVGFKSWVDVERLKRVASHELEDANKRSAAAVEATNQNTKTVLERLEKAEGRIRALEMPVALGKGLRR